MPAQTTVDLSSYDPMERSIQQDPFPYYAELRRSAPVFLHPATGIYFISRLDTVRQVLADTKTFSSRMSNVNAAPPPGIARELGEIMSQGWSIPDTMLTADPPQQTRYRKLVGPEFSAKSIKKFEPKIREIANRLIDTWPQEGRVDFVNSFSVPYPVNVMAHVLNMNPEVIPRIKPWSDAQIAALGVALTDEARLAAAKLVVECQQYWAGEFEARRKNPQQDFLTILAHAEFEAESGEKRLLEIPELISIINQLMVAGNETTTKLINETVRMLIENPREWQRIQEDPGTIPAMVEEAMRMSSPNQGLFRIVMEDIELEGVKVPKGARLWVMFGSANRDERFFPDPDRFDPTRENLRDHVALGRGAHFCIGAALARLDARVCFEEFVRRIESMNFAPGNAFEYEPSYILRGLKNLELDLRLRRSAA